MLEVFKPNLCDRFLSSVHSHCAQVFQSGGNKIPFWTMVKSFCLKSIFMERQTLISENTFIPPSHCIEILCARAQ